MEIPRPGAYLDDLEFLFPEEDDKWIVKCACGRLDEVHFGALQALHNVGMHIACSRCRIEQPFKPAIHISDLPSPVPTPPDSPVFHWSEGETSE